MSQTTNQPTNLISKEMYNKETKDPTQLHYLLNDFILQVF